MSTAEQVRRLRESAGWTQARLAEVVNSLGAAHMYPQTILKIEKGARGLAFDEAVLICRALGVQLDALTGAGSPQAEPVQGSSPAARVRSTREGAGLTQTALAELARSQGFPFHQQTIAKIESGERPLRVDEAARLAEVLAVSPSWLAGFSESAHEFRAGYLAGIVAAREALGQLAPTG